MALSEANQEYVTYVDKIVPKTLYCIKKIEDSKCTFKYFKIYIIIFDLYNNLHYFTED